MFHNTSVFPAVSVFQKWKHGTNKQTHLEKPWSRLVEPNLISVLASEHKWCWWWWWCSFSAVEIKYCSQRLSQQRWCRGSDALVCVALAVNFASTLCPVHLNQLHEVEVWTLSCSCIKWSQCLASLSCRMMNQTSVSSFVYFPLSHHSDGSMYSLHYSIVLQQAAGMLRVNQFFYDNLHHGCLVVGDCQFSGLDLLKFKYKLKLDAGKLLKQRANADNV